MVPLHPRTQEQVCGELVEYVDDFRQIMKDETKTADRPTAILQHYATIREALTWLAKFNRYFESKEEELLNRGYRRVDHGRIVLNAYIDHELEMKLDRDLRGDGVGTRGKRGCIAHLTQYFRRNGNGNDRTHLKPVTPINLALHREGLLLIDSLARHSGMQAAQAREHKQLKRRKRYASATKLQHPASIPGDNQHTTIIDLPNKILEQICKYLPFQALRNLIEATKELRDLSTIEKRTGQAINLTGEYLKESKLRQILTRKATYTIPRLIKSRNNKWNGSHRNGHTSGQVKPKGHMPINVQRPTHMNSINSVHARQPNYTRHFILEIRIN